jgi:hypothetical protein
MKVEREYGRLGIAIECCTSSTVLQTSQPKKYVTEHMKWPTR